MYIIGGIINFSPFSASLWFQKFLWWMDIISIMETSRHLKTIKYGNLCWLVISLKNTHSLHSPLLEPSSMLLASLISWIFPRLAMRSLMRMWRVPSWEPGHVNFIQGYATNSLHTLEGNLFPPGTSVSSMQWGELKSLSSPPQHK